MMKKIYFLLAALLIGVIAMAYLYFSKLDADTNSNDLALNRITEQAALVFCFANEKSFYDILQGQDLLNDLVGDQKSKVFIDLVRLANSRNGAAQLDQHKINIGFIPNGDQIDFLINTQLQEDFFVERLADIAVKIQKLESIYQLTFNDGVVCYASLADRVLSISNNQKQLLLHRSAGINSFTTYINENSRQQKNILANLYINFSKLNQTLASILQTKVDGELDLFNHEKAFANLGYNFGTQKILFNGYTTLRSDSSYYSLFINEKEQKITIDAILPINTANYTFLGINTYEEWGKNLDRFLRIHKDYDRKQQEIETVKNNFRIDLNQLLPKYFKNQAIAFQLATGEKLGAIALTNGDKLGQLLIDLSADYAPDVKIFKRPALLYYYFGDIFKKFERPFYTIKDNYLIFANNASTVQSFLNSYSNRKNLSETENYKDFANQLSSSATLSMYINSSNSSGIMKRQLKSPYYHQYESEPGFKDYNAFCYQLTADNGKFATNMLILKKIKEVVSDTTSNP